MDKQQRCKFYKEGQPKSCKNGSKCPFKHQNAEQRKKSDQMISQDRSQNVPAHKEHHKQPAYATHRVQQAERQGKNPHYQNNDQESKQKVNYLSKLMDSLKSKCLKCKELEHLVLTTCGCQKVCSECALKAEKCEFCHRKIDSKLLIRAFS